MLSLRHSFGRTAARSLSRHVPAPAPRCLSAAAGGNSGDRTVLPGRESLVYAKRITVKLGSQVVTRSNGSGIAFGRLFNVVEQLAQLKSTGRDLVIVTSGAVAAGRHRLRHLEPGKSQPLPIPSRPLPLPGSVSSGLPPSPRSGPQSKLTTMACSASGQSGLMAMYEWMFGQYSIDCAQVLVSQADMADEQSRARVLSLIEDLLKGGLVPIVNENDAIPGPPSSFEPGSQLVGNINLDDNDGFASLLSAASGSDLLMLMSNVDGVYSADPRDDPAATRLRSIPLGGLGDDEAPVLTGKSLAGRGGMESKVAAASFAQQNGVSCVVASGMVDPMLGLHRSILDVVEGRDVGTLFPSASDTSAEVATAGGSGENGTGAAVGDGSESAAFRAREGGSALRSVSADQRSAVIERLADLLVEEEAGILAANQLDLEAAKQGKGLSESLYSRLKLSGDKLGVLAAGLRQIARDSKDVLGRVVSSTELAVAADCGGGGDLVLVKETVPIGTLLVIFESRPDVLPQVAALAIGTGNGIVLKGGSEAAHSNRYLHGLVTRALGEVEGTSDTTSTVAGAGAAPLTDACQLIESRGDVAGLLGLDHLIDLVIPRGGNELVQSIQRSTRIPVLGHADGICHAFVDAAADPATALDVLRDAKCDYPAACNAVETVLLHRSLLDDASPQWAEALAELGTAADGEGPITAAQAIVRHLQHNDVTLRAGPVLSGLLQDNPALLGAGSAEPATSMHVEYGTLECAVEVVDDLPAAVQHIRRHGSGHTEVVLTEDEAAAEAFLGACDSACVFHNASSRFADGFRFGLGAEVGISTARIHARGPVGMEGLLSTTYKLRGSGHTVGAVAEGKYVYTHRKLE